MTIRHLTTILAALLALLIVAPASANWGTNWSQAAEPEYSIDAYVNPLSGEIWLAGRLPMDTAYDARSLVAYTDADDIARNLDMIVMAEDTLDPIDALGIGPMQMYAGIMGADDAVAMLTSYGADVWLFVIVVPDIRALDAETVVTWTVDTMTRGVAIAPGAGFVALDAGQTPALGGEWT